MSTKRLLISYLATQIIWFNLFKSLDTPQIEHKTTGRCNCNTRLSWTYYQATHPDRRCPIRETS